MRNLRGMMHGEEIPEEGIEEMDEGGSQTRDGEVRQNRGGQSTSIVHEGGGLRFPPRKKEEDDAGNRGSRMGPARILKREKVREFLGPGESDPRTEEWKKVRESPLRGIR